LDLRNSRMADMTSASEGPGRKGRSSSELSTGDGERGFGFGFGFCVGVVFAFFLGGEAYSSDSSSSEDDSSSLDCSGDDLT
jgi:hypothetical protein